MKINGNKKIQKKQEKLRNKGKNMSKKKIIKNSIGDKQRKR
jgi:hypothetical protein